MAELRHDFRRYYGCSYDDVQVEEKIDLIRMLPDGSRYVAGTDPERAWSEERHRFADVIDAISPVAWALAYDREKVPEPPKVVRPKDMLARAEASRRAARARAELESGTWEEI